MTVDEQAAGAPGTSQRVRFDDSPGPRTGMAPDADTVAASGFDIGVASRQSDHGARSEATARRRLPIWVVGILALFAGWVLGTLLASAPDAPSAEPASFVGAAEPLADEAPVSPSVSPDPVTAPAVSTVPIPGAALVVGFADTDDPAGSIMLVHPNGSTSIGLPDDLASPGLVGSPGDVVLAADDSVFFVAGDRVYTLNAVNDGSAFAITKANSLMPGTGTGNLWAVLSEAQTVQLVDVGSRSVRATYDLSTIGTPLASYDGGLIVAPNIERFGPFALWSPARGIERIWSIDEEAMFVDAAAQTIVMHTAQGVASYNTVTGSLTQTERRLSDSQLQAALVSPDGRLLAVLEQPNSDTSTVAILDLNSGNEIDTFEVATPTALRWVSGNQLVHLSTRDSMQIQLRDTARGFGTRLFAVDGVISWLMLID